MTAYEDWQANRTTASDGAGSPASLAGVVAALERIATALEKIAEERAI